MNKAQEAKIMKIFGNDLIPLTSNELSRDSAYSTAHFKKIESRAKNRKYGSGSDMTQLGEGKKHGQK